MTHVKSFMIMYYLIMYTVSDIFQFIDFLKMLIEGPQFEKL